MREPRIYLRSLKAQGLAGRRRIRHEMKELMAALRKAVGRAVEE